MSLTSVYMIFERVVVLKERKFVKKFKTTKVIFK